MTDPNKTLIAVVLDRSGSMSSCHAATVEGFNAFVAEQKKLDSDVRLSLYQFDHDYDVVYENAAVKLLSPMAMDDFVPRGNTALLDAIGKTVVSLGKTLAALPEHERPGKVIVVVITDGQENSSVEFHRSTVKRLIETQEKVYNWRFIFLGANQDGVLAGESMGFSTQRSATYATKSADRAIRRAGSMVRCMASSDTVYACSSFSPEDRSEMDGNS